jgi:transposase
VSWRSWTMPARGMMVALLLYGYCQGERSSRVIEKRCVRDVAYRVITGGLRPDHATIARFRARHEEALGRAVSARSGCLCRSQGALLAASCLLPVIPVRRLAACA